MKKKILILSVLCFLTINLAFKNETINSFPLFGKLIIVDAGHGGLDPGSVYKDDYEKNYNLLMAQSLKKILERNGATVLMTRDGDYDLSSPNASRRKKSDFDNRIKLINNSKADMYLSLHMNYLEETKYYGAQCFYSTNNEYNKTVAEICQKNFNKFFDFDKTSKKISDDKYMFKQIDVTGILIEYGFISNSSDRVNLKKEEYRNNISKIILNALIQYFT